MRERPRALIPVRWPANPLPVGKYTRSWAACTVTVSKFVPNRSVTTPTSNEVGHPVGQCLGTISTIRPVLLGTMRTGPDLANIGAGPGKGLRWYAGDWHHKHLYEPEMMVPGSKMAKFAFLYEKRKIIGQKSQDALDLTGKWADRLAPDEELVPTSEAKALVAYLLSLDHTHDLPEAKE